MFYTPKIQKAIRFATKVHINQKRKGKEDPYIIHPLSVGLILSRAGADEDIVVAGILHDTIEDSDPYGSITFQTIEKEFGANIARMVNDVTEQDKNLSWAERKKAALEHMKEMEQDSLLLKSADVLHNFSDLLQDIEEKGDVAYEKFSGSKEEVNKRFQDLLSEFERLCPANPLLPEIAEKVNKITEE